MKIAFTGDIAFSKYFSGKEDAPNLISSEIARFLGDSDYTVANVEGAVTDRVFIPDGSANPYHASSPKAVAWLKKINANIWNLSNNHTTDCGDVGLIDTIELAKRNDCVPLGAGENKEQAKKPVILDGAGGYRAFKRLLQKETVCHV